MVHLCEQRANLAIGSYQVSNGFYSLIEFTLIGMKKLGSQNKTFLGALGSMSIVLATCLFSSIDGIIEGSTVWSQPSAIQFAIKSTGIHKYSSQILLSISADNAEQYRLQLWYWASSSGSLQN